MSAVNGTYSDFRCYTPKDCLNLGICREGVCLCYSPFKGDDCSSMNIEKKLA